MVRFFSLAVLLCLPAAVRAKEPEAAPRLQLRAVGELGFLGVQSNTVRYGQQGTVFRFTEDGGQDNLFLLPRLAAELSWRGRHSAILLYQPIDLRGETLLTREVSF